MLSKLRGLNNERGQAIVTIALMSVFILAILGVVADTGYVWLQRRNLQNAADAAALAAAQKLPGDQAEASTLANDYGGVTAGRDMAGIERQCLFIGRQCRVQPVLLVQR